MLFGANTTKRLTFIRQLRAAIPLFGFSALLCLYAHATFAQKFSFQRYDVADGLANSVVLSIYQDKKGFIWIATWEGLSRFDGYDFTNYGVRDGLGHTIINDVKEDRQGRLWAATNGGGVSWLIDRQAEIPTGLNIQAKQKFVSFRVGDNPVGNNVNRMLFDADNNMWCLTDFGVYRASLDDVANLKFAPVTEASPSSQGLIENDGRVWFSSRGELFEFANGEVINHGSSGEGAEITDLTSGEKGDYIWGIVKTRDGKLLVSTYVGLYEFASGGKNGRGQWVKQPLALDGWRTTSMFEDSGGSLWLNTYSPALDGRFGLIKYENGRQKLYQKTQGFGFHITAFGEDIEGNLWFGTYGGGIYKFGGDAFTGFTKDSSTLGASEVFESREGKIVAVLWDSSVAEINEGEIKPLPESENAVSLSLSRSRSSHIALDKGEWIWGGYSFVRKIKQPVIELRDGRKISLKDYFPEADLGKIIAFYEDENGAVWFVKDNKDIYRLDARTKAALEFVVSTKELHGVPQILSDRKGGVWFGGIISLCRWRENQFKCFQTSDGLPAVEPRSLYFDSRGWLWVGLRYNGVSVSKNPLDDEPQFFNYSDKDGLVSNAVWNIAEDDFGRMYFATQNGLEQFDPAKNLWRHFNSKNGLAGDTIGSLFKDRQGNLWICTNDGLTKFNPQAERAGDRPPPIYLSRVRIAGENLTMAEAGANEIPLAELQPERNNLTIEYVGLNFTGEDNLTYQYKLEGTGEDWSAPTKQRVVNYARLAAGDYRFLVRAVNREGMPSVAPASVSFRILPPIYQRWWFIVSAAVLIGLAVYSIYRNRLNRLLEIEHTRMRIATDLHDDIGANLTKIAILSEVAQQRFARAGDRDDELLPSIAEISRESVSAMGDIVWAINPKKDSLEDLARRMRQHAGEVLEQRDIFLEFNAPDAASALKLDANTRRNIYLIFKESLNNIIRHAHASMVWIDLEIVGGEFVMKIEDDGVGFDAGREPDGNGLLSMKKRASDFGGRLEINSAIDRGTRVELRFFV